MKKYLFLLLLSLNLLPGPVGAQMMGNWGYGYNIMGCGLGFSWLGFAANIIFWVLLIALIIMFAKWILRTSGSRNSALDILKERYAKGEINKEEFEQKKKDITI